MGAVPGFARGRLAPIAAFIVAGAAPPAGAASVTVDGSERHQTMVGFGGDFAPWELGAGTNRQGGQVPGLGAPDVQKLLEFAVKTMRLNLVRADVIYFEGDTAASFWGSNDNDDPFSIDWNRFNFGPGASGSSNELWKTFLPQLRALGVTGEYWGLIQGPSWNGFDGGSRFNEDEMVENQLAWFLHTRDVLGLDTKWVAPFSEPGGGGINWPITAAQVVNVIKKLGARLEANGFVGIKMVVPDCTSETQSLEYMQAVLADPDARKWVGALGYHNYGLGGGGQNPIAAWIANRQALKGLGEPYGIPLRQTEWCCDADLMSRANHIYNELFYADSQTYFPQQLFARGNASSGDACVYFETDAAGALGGFGPTEGAGVAIGQYSRFARPDSVRLATTSTDRAVRALAFREDAAGGSKLGMVIINNKATKETVSVSLSAGLRLVGDLHGDETNESDLRASRKHWAQIAAISPSTTGTFSLTVSPRSITSVEASLADEGSDAGAAPDGGSVRDANIAEISASPEAGGAVARDAGDTSPDAARSSGTTCSCRVGTAPDNPDTFEMVLVAVAGLLGLGRGSRCYAVQKNLPDGRGCTVYLAQTVGRGLCAIKMWLFAVDISSRHQEDLDAT